MRSFQKTSDFRCTANGTKTKNNLTYVSSGIPSLDHVIGGGLPAGSVFVVEEDVLGNYSRVLIKYFLAEGVASKHSLLVASADEDPQEIVKELPQPCAAPPEDEVAHEPIQSSSAEKMKIAWRYEGLGQVESSFGNKTNFGHNFDLSKHIDADTVKNCDVTYLKLESNHKIVKGFRNSLYHKLLCKIKQSLSTEEFKTKNLLRIGIHSLGSPIWMSMDCEEIDISTYGRDIMKFMYCLRAVVRDTNAIAFVTIPSHLFDDDHIMRRILYSVDNAVKIESFAGSSRETNPAYKDYHGLFHITKLSSLYSIVPYVPPSLDLAFKLKRKKFLIQKLHIPPELEETSEREQDDITATPPVNCGGFKKSQIDF